MRLRLGTGTGDTESDGPGPFLRVPGPDLVHDLCARASREIGWLDQLWPVLTDDFRHHREGARVAVPDEDDSQPTGEAVIELVEPSAEADVPGVLLMLRVLEAVQALDEACAELETLPAVAEAAPSLAGELDGYTALEHKKPPGDSERAAALSPPRHIVADDLECLVCYRSAPRLVSGMDEPCYHAWMRAGRPEREPWAQARRRWLQAHSRAVTDTVEERLHAPSAEAVLEFVHEVFEEGP